MEKGKGGEGKEEVGRGGENREGSCVIGRGGIDAPGLEASKPFKWGKFPFMKLSREMPPNRCK